jgi:membrane-associated phospholipid phosphatase
LENSFKYMSFVLVKSIPCFLLIFFFSLTNAFSQENPSPYRIARAEAWAAPLTAVFAGAGWYSQHRVQPFTRSEIENLDLNAIPAFDRWNAGDWRPKAARVSDIGVGLAFAAPLVIFAAREPRRDFLKIALMASEAGLTASGLVNTTKGIAQRTRPYVYGTAAPLDERFSDDGRLSFFSGHTAFSATACFFGAKVFHDYFPQSKLRPWVWTVAALAPAGIGYLRVRAGKHFLSDVLTGYAVGAAVGYLVPRLHRNNVARTLSVTPSFWKGGSGVVVGWEF